WDFGVVVEESARPSLCQVRKLVYINRSWECPVWVGLASREPTPQDGSSVLRNRWTSRGTLLGQGRMDWLRNITRAKIDKLAKVMKSCHNFDSTVSLEFLAVVQKRFSIPNERRGWDFRVEWSAHLVSNVPPNLSDEESNLVKRLKGILFPSRAIRSLTEEWLVEASLSPASRGMP
ncbi:hypothetical protein BHE74_00005779, partial [Ensete ventricosum]